MTFDHHDIFTENNCFQMNCFARKYPLFQGFVHAGNKSRNHYTNENVALDAGNISSLEKWKKSTEESLKFAEMIRKPCVGWGREFLLDL